MKKAIAILMVLVALVTAMGAFADGLWYQNGQWWNIDRDGYLHPIENKLLTWDPSTVIGQFPSSVIRDVSTLCARLNGEPMGCLGLTSKAGSNLRSAPNIDGGLIYDKDGNQDYTHPSIVRKLHADTTVYVYFRFYAPNGDEWYYVTCTDGLEGYLLAKRIMLVSGN